MPALQFYVLDALPSEVVLGMPFLQRCNPTIDWVARTVSFGLSRVLSIATSRGCASRVVFCEVIVEDCAQGALHCLVLFVTAWGCLSVYGSQ